MRSDVRYGRAMAEPPVGRVTMLFTDVEGSTRLAHALGDAWPTVLSDHHRILRTAIKTQGGHVERTAGDSFFALFGEPSSAVTAAVDAQRALSTRDWPDAVGELHVRMGLHTGTVERSAGELTGLDIHLAARVAAVAHGGQVVVTEATREAVGGRFELLALGGHRLKDFPVPERLFLLVHDGRGPADFPPLRTPSHVTGVFVGRERELRHLEALLEDTLSFRGRMVLVGGEAGIGKSHLVDELAALATKRGSRVLWGRCWEAGGAPAYWPWVQSLRSYLGCVAPQEISEALRTGAPDLAQMLPELRDLFPDLPTPPSLDPEGARFRLFDATAGFLRDVARRTPVVIVLDDLHAADEPSLLLLEFLAQQLTETRVLMLGTYRETEVGPEHPLSRALTQLASRAGSRMSLTGLQEADIARFIQASHAVQPPPGLAAAIHRETDGNPLFVGEVLRLLAAEGRLDETVDARARRIAIPPSARAVIGRRLGHLSDKCKRVLLFASVLGREFGLDPLARVGEQDVDVLLDLLDEAISAGVVGDVPGVHGRLRFSHVLIRDALYDELTATRRMRLHRRVGEALEAVYASDPDPHLAELAHHFFEAVPAGDAAKAMHYARRAADRAATLLAYEEAARLYAIAFEVIESNAAGNGRDRCDVLLGLGDVQARAGDILRAKETFLKAADAARRAGLPEHLARAALGYGGRFVWMRAWGDKHLVPLLEEALSVLPERDSPLRVRLLARLAAGPLRDTLPPEPREAMTQEALERARRLGDAATLAYALDGRHCANLGPEVLDQRLALADELIEVAEGARDGERAYEGHDYRFHALLEAGDLSAAHREFEAFTRLAEELRQPAQLWFAAVNRAKLALFEGSFADAETAICEAAELGRSMQSANAQLAFDLQMYALRREQGRLGELVEVVERAVDEYSGYPVWRYVVADVFAELGRKDEARAAFEVLAADGFVHYLEMQWLFSISLAPDVCGYLGDVERAATLYELLQPYAHRNATLPPELCHGSVSRGLGVLAATMRKWNLAVQHFDDALLMNGAMGARPWLAHTQYDYGRMLLAREPDDRRRAHDLLAAAKALSEELGMKALAEKVSALSTA